MGKDSLATQNKLVSLIYSDDERSFLRRVSQKVIDEVQSMAAESKKTFPTEDLEKRIMDAYFSKELPDEVPAKERWFIQELIQKCIRDTLSVLAAINAIEVVDNRDDKKQFRWTGLTKNPRRELLRLNRERAIINERICIKRKQLQRLVSQAALLENLYRRNRDNPHKVSLEERIHLPFTMLNTDRGAKIEFMTAANQNDVMVNFNKPFQIQDDSDVLLEFCDSQKLDRTMSKSKLPNHLLDFLPRNFNDVK